MDPQSPSQDLPPQDGRKISEPSPTARGTDGIFGAARVPERSSIQWLPWIVAGLVVFLMIGALLLATHRKPAAPGNAVLPLDPYASSLVLTDLQMSESTSLSGGKSTFIDGHIRNQGARTVTGATVQVLFANDEAFPPQVETLPLAVIRTREPYIDTQPLGAAPLPPGAEREFRLIFEDIGSNWNQQLPVIRPVHISTQ